MKVIIALALFVACCSAANWRPLPKDVPQPKFELLEKYRAAYKAHLRDRYIEDTGMTIPELLTKYGYPVEQHEVTTIDGYILTLFRIPYGKKCGQDQQRRPAPVLLQHGLLMSAADYIIMGPDKAWGYLLADNCYDVWLGNSRGNVFSRRHTRYDPDKDEREFWNFSWHEMGQYDLPSVIDYITRTTGLPDIYYIGHSQGTTEFFIFSSLYPSYAAEKVRAMFALAPVSYMENIHNPLLKLISQFDGTLDFLADLVGINEFLPHSFTTIGELFCESTDWLTLWLCEDILFLITGHSDEVNTTMLPVIFGHFPAGCSTKQLLHYAQSIHNGGFRQYDYGRSDNNDIYGTPQPPSYELEKIQVPIGLYCSDNDALASCEDAQLLSEKLQNLIVNYRVPHHDFNHMDFLWSIEGPELLYNTIIETMSHY